MDRGCLSRAAPFSIYSKSLKCIIYEECYNIILHLILLLQLYLQLHLKP